MPNRFFIVRATLLAGLAVSWLVLAGCPGPSPDARQWSVVSERLPEALLSIGGRSSSDVWAVGADKGRGPIVLHYDGSRWERRETGHHGHLWWVHV
ncbi:MAG: hypothetical protein ACK5U8_34105, partial [Deltaproteobacteria bacterium]